MTVAIPTKQTVILKGRRIACLQAGRGAPLLLVHGFPTTSLLWKSLIGPLSAHYSVYAPDLMGFGDSEPAPGEPCHLEAQAEMLCGFMDHFSMEPVIFVGHDLGGGIGQIFGLEYPEKLSRLVLANAVAFDNFPVPETRVLIQISRCFPLFRAINRLNILRRWARSRFFGLRKGLFDPLAMSDEAIEEYMGRPFFSSDHALGRLRRIAFTQRDNARITMKIALRLNRIKTPTLVVWGKEDRFMPWHWGKRLAEEIPGTRRFELIPEAGHFFPEEKSPEFARLLLEWLSPP